MSDKTHDKPTHHELEKVQDATPMERPEPQKEQAMTVLKKRELEAFDELRHKRKIKRIDRVAGIIWIPKEGRIGDHQRRQPCIPERGVITQAGFRQNPSIEGQAFAV
jgi:hypothetical protein